MKLFKSEKSQLSKSGGRQVRLCQEVQRFVSELLIQGALPPVEVEGAVISPDPFMTVSRADVAPDMKTAKIYVRHFDSEKLTECLTYLEAVKSMIRRTMAKTLNMRFTPQLSFHRDVLIDQERRMDELFSKI